MKGRVIIDFERDEEKETCDYTLKQEGKDTLDNDDLINLLKHVIGELVD